MTAAELIDDDTFLGAENSYNLFTVQKDSAASSDDERMRLQVHTVSHVLGTVWGVVQQTGVYHLGEMVNVFRRGSLLSSSMDVLSSTPLTSPIIYGTVEGGLGLVMQIPPDFFKSV